MATRVFAATPVTNLPAGATRSNGSSGNNGSGGMPPAVHERLLELRNLRAVSRTCMLQALREGRLVAVALPKNDLAVQSALACKPPLLGSLEAFVLREAEQDTDAAVLFALGLYWSELGVTVGDAPLFGSHSQDWGSGDDVAALNDKTDDTFSGPSHSVPAAIARSEALLLRGEEASVIADERSERGATRALRLYQHAKCLALMHHDAAAEARYRKSAEVAASNGRSKLAGHALTRLSYFLSLRGKNERSLTVAQQALGYGSDPLAEYLQATLRRTLGELRSVEEVFEAESVLGTVAGRLPSQGLELQRSTAHRELQLLRQTAAEGGIQACSVLLDAARFLLCALCKLIFPVTPVAKEVTMISTTDAAAAPVLPFSGVIENNATALPVPAEVSEEP